MIRRPFRRIGLFGLVITGLLAGLITAGWSAVNSEVAPAQAASASGFNPGMIISDQTFYNSGAITSAQAQAFIAAQGNAVGCRANGSVPCLKDVLTTNAATGATSYCAAIPAASSQNAGSVVTRIGQACGINPEVLIVLLEKEQGLVSVVTPYAYKYDYATGFACPDSTGCNPANAGFFNQVYAASQQFKIYRAQPYSFNYVAGRTNTIQYNPNKACGTAQVYIQNQATAGLYDYTPYVPDAAALTNLYGTGDSCSSYGNRNFWRIFSDWFGNPSGQLLTCGSFDGCSNGWSFPAGMGRSFNPDSTAQSGSGDLAVHATVAGTSFSQTVNRSMTVGDTYQASIWVRGRGAGSSVTGTAAIWGLGGSGSENQNTTFTVGSNWTLVTVQFQAQMRSHSQVRFEIYLNTTNYIAEFDSASLAQIMSLPSTANPPLSSPSFDNGYGNWGIIGSGVNRAIYSGAGAQSGSSYMATNTPTAGGSVYQDISWPVGVATSYTASIWVKSATGTNFSGALALWGLLGPGTTGASTPFVATNQWTKVQVTLPVTTFGQSYLRLQVYEYTAAPLTLNLDNASLQANLLSNGSFESGGANWQPNESGTNLAVYTASQISGTVVDGSRVGATNVPNAGGSIYTQVNRTMQPGENYTATVWMRLASPGASFSGTLALWEIGATSANNNIPVTVGNTWQQYTISRRITQSGDTGLRLQLYENTPGVTVFLDGAVLN